MSVEHRAVSVTDFGIVIVDDHEAVASAWAHVLRSRGFGPVVHTADPTPSRVLELVDAVDGQLVLVDLHIGSSSGLDLIPLLRDAGVRVVAITGVGDHVDLGRALLAGAVGAFEKSMELDELIDVLDRLRAGRDPMSTSEREGLIAAARRSRVESEAMRGPFDRLSPRETAVLRHLMDGRAPASMAHRDGVSLATVRTQIRSLFLKLDVQTEREAIARAHRAGWR